MGAGAKKAETTKRNKKDRHRKGVAAITRVGNRTDLPDNEAADLGCPSNVTVREKQLWAELPNADVETVGAGSSIKKQTYPPVRL